MKANKMTGIGIVPVEVVGELFKLFGYFMFLNYVSEFEIALTEWTSGMIVCKGTSKNDCIQKITKYLQEDHSNKMKAAVEQAISIHGIANKSDPVKI